MGPIPHHMHQGFKHAALTGQQGKPESYYFPPQYNNVDNNFAYTFMGLEPGTTKAQLAPVPGELAQGRQRHSRPVEGLSPEARHRLADSAWRAARPRLAVHLRAAVGLATCSACSSRWSKGAKCPGRCWSRTCRKDKHQDLDFIIEQLDWEKNVDTHFKEHNYLEPIVDAGRSGAGLHRSLDRLRHGRRRAVVQRQGADRRAGRQVHAQRSRRQRLDHRAGSRPHGQAQLANAGHDPLRRGDRGRSVHHRTKPPPAGVEIENTGSEPLVGLRYFGPDVHKNLPKIGDYKQARRNKSNRSRPHVRCTGRLGNTFQTHPSENAITQWPHTNNFPKLHNAAWPGVVGKGEGSEPPIGLGPDARSDGRRPKSTASSSTASTCSCSIRTSASTPRTTI